MPEQGPHSAINSHPAENQPQQVPVQNTHGDVLLFDPSQAKRRWQGKSNPVPTYFPNVQWPYQPRMVECFLFLETVYLLPGDIWVLGRQVFHPGKGQYEDRVARLISAEQAVNWFLLHGEALPPDLAPLAEKRDLACSKAETGKPAKAKRRRRKKRIAELLLALLDDRLYLHKNQTELAEVLECSPASISRAFVDPEYRRRLKDLYAEYDLKPPTIDQI